MLLDEFFENIFPRLMVWDKDSLEDISSYILSDFVPFPRDLVTERIYGTVKSMSDPRGEGRVAFYYKSQNGKDHLDLRTTNHRMELFWEFRNPTIDVVDGGEAFGAITRNRNVFTIADHLNRGVGRYARKERFLQIPKPIYGRIQLSGNDIGELNSNLLCIYKLYKGLLPNRWLLKPCFRKITPSLISEEDQRWLLVLLGMEITSSIQDTFYNRPD